MTGRPEWEWGKTGQYILTEPGDMTEDSETEVKFNNQGRRRDGQAGKSLKHRTGQNQEKQQDDQQNLISEVTKVK